MCSHSANRAAPRSRTSAKPEERAGRYPAPIYVQSRECSPQLLERLTGATFFPERSAGSAIVNTVCRSGGHLLYVTAPAMIEADQQVDYYLSLLPGDPARRHADARARVHIVTLDDTSSRWLSEKILDTGNPEAARVRAAIHAFAQHEKRHGGEVVLKYFEPSQPLEELARALGVPGDQSHSSYIPLGTKDAGRHLMRSAGLDLPAGSALCHTTTALAEETARLVRQGHRKFVLKLNSTAYGGGLGNALLDLSNLGGRVPHAADNNGSGLTRLVLTRLPHAALVDPKISWEQFTEMIEQSGAIAEELVEADEVLSPSFQGRITDRGTVEVVSTHDQILSASGQTFTGCSFPADAEYRQTITDHGVRVGLALLERGVDSGDYGVDFLVTRSPGGSRILGCELNLRATGTKHAFTMVTGLLGVSPTQDGRLLVDGAERVYEASDGIMNARYRGLLPTQLIRAVTESPLRYDHTRKTGVVLHMMSAVVTYGKFGAVCVGQDRAEARRMMRELRELIGGLAPATG